MAFSYIALLVVSVIFPVAIVTEPVITAGASDDGTYRFMSNVSSPSTMSSSVTTTLTVV